MHHSNDFGLFGDLAVNILITEVAVLVQVDVLQHSALSLRNLLPRHEVGVVFEYRQDNLITDVDVVEAVTIGDEVEGLSGILREDDLSILVRVDEFSNLCPRALVDVRCLDTKLIGTPVRVGIAAAVVAADSSDDRIGLLRGGAVVEVNYRLAVHSLIQYRKVLNIFVT